ncbi:MAG: aldo/keto reductase [Anaerolineae bacterium]|nr:aldo/keto reductase [Anaerolineae bacterium]
MTLHGRATPDATRAYADRLGDRCVPEHFRQTTTGLSVSSIGLGTYLGEPDDATDAAYRAAVGRALALGCNHLDTAVNYRCQRSERAVGQALRAAVERGNVRREEVVIATKGGFVPFDGTPPADPRKWIYETYIASGLAHPNDFAANYQHCLAPDFLDAMIARSRRNLGVDTIDIYYLHNPETQRISNTRETFRARMLDAFETLEDAVTRGEIAAYGTATWTAYRCPPDAPDYVSLTELVGLAFQVAGDANHFRYVQMPYNLVMTEAFALTNQQVGEEFLSATGAAETLGLAVITSAALKQGVLAAPFMADLAPYFPQAQTDAQRAIQFARSTPGVTCALVGTNRVEHVEENLALAGIRPVDADVIWGLFSEG